MRPIHIARLDRQRPVVLLTRELVRETIGQVTVAPITTTAKGLFTEVQVGRANGLDHDSVISCDSIQTIAKDDLGQQIGWLPDAREPELAAAISHAFDLYQ